SGAARRRQSGAVRSEALTTALARVETLYTCTLNSKRAVHAPHSHSWVFTALRLVADSVGGVMFNTRGWIALGLLSTFALPAMAQSFRVQCPTSTVTHPLPANNNSDPAYVGPTYTGTSGYGTTPAHVNGASKCQQISGG